MLNWALILFAIALVAAVVGWIGLTGTSRAVYLLFLCIIIGLALVALLTVPYEERAATSSPSKLSHGAANPVRFSGGTPQDRR
jgi:uncharacterized membrane protein YtjA (UPF0391 family)